MPLEDLLAQALPAPGAVKPCTEGALLALALHCLMVEDGFIALDAGGKAQLGPRSRFRPPAEWNTRPYEWVFLYVRRGAANRFRLHVAFHPGAGRIFVHGSELLFGGDAPLEGNIALLGLQLDNYVSSAAAAGRQASWAGVITNEDKLRKFFGQHILGPLAARAEPLPAGRGALPAGVEVSWLGQYAQQGLERWRAAAQGHEAALLVAVGVTLAAAGLAVVALRAKAASGR